jgi:hypothetical protein
MPLGAKPFRRRANNIYYRQKRCVFPAFGGGKPDDLCLRPFRRGSRERTFAEWDTDPHLFLEFPHSEKARVTPRIAMELENEETIERMIVVGLGVDFTAQAALHH